MGTDKFGKKKDNKDNKKFDSKKKNVNKADIKKADVKKPVYKSFLYLLTELVSAGELSAVLDFIDKDAIEVWTDVNVLEITTKNGTVTFEDLMSSLRKDDKELLEKMSVKQVYACDYQDLDQRTVRDIMQKLTASFAGKIASDTEDFQPFMEISQL